MQKAGDIARENFDRIIFENKMMGRGYSTIPYMVLFDARLSHGAVRTYGVLLYYGWQEGSCFPGQAALAEKVHCSERWVRKFLGELREFGYLDWRKRGYSKTNLYIILDPLKRAKAERKASTGKQGSGIKRKSSSDLKRKSSSA